MLEESEVQRLLLSGHGRLPHAVVLFLRFSEASEARQVLQDLTGRVTFGEDHHEHCRLQLALGFPLLELLGLPSRTLEGFPPEFQEGTLTSARLQHLGDHGSSSPECWHWGARPEDQVHLALFFYARDAQERDEFSPPLPAGAQVLYRQNMDLPADHREPFGFRDGLSQPQILGRHPRPGGPNPEEISDPIAPGEFILGYPNQRGHHPPSPPVCPDCDPEDLLSPHANRPGAKDLGKNGSYLVIRQLQQHVETFRTFLRETAAAFPEPEKDEEWIAAKMVGRWPDGRPLSLCPLSEDPPPNDQKEKAPFSFRSLDPKGHRCPLGAHIRRANPRDSLIPDAKRSLFFSNLHRIIRRGRIYRSPDGKEVGLLFLCFNSSIRDQFEFIQHDWLNSTKFDGQLDCDSDPISGAQDPDDPALTDNFTIQARPLRSRITGLPRFVDVRGSAYLFCPGKAALKWLSQPLR